MDPRRFPSRLSTPAPATLSYFDILLLRSFYIAKYNISSCPCQSVFKRLCTHTAKDDVPKRTIFENTWIPEDFLLAFQHPHPQLSHILIYIMGDMPHILKKLTNALEMSSNEKSRRFLCIKGEHISLDGLDKVWLTARGGKGNTIRTDRISKDMYCMCVHLCANFARKAKRIW